MVELERVSRDPAWLDKAIRIVDRLVREANGKHKGKGLEEPLAAWSSSRHRAATLPPGHERLLVLFSYSSREGIFTSARLA